MKKLLLLTTLLAVFFACNQPKATPVAQTAMPNEHTSSLSVAVVNVDTLLENYNFAIDMNEHMIAKQEDIRVDLSQKAKAFKAEVANFQLKVQNNAFLSRERGESEQQRLAQKEQDLQAFQQKQANDFTLEQQNLSLQVRDSIKNVINIYNETHQFDIILSTNSMNDNILFSQKKFDITLDLG